MIPSRVIKQLLVDEGSLVELANGKWPMFIAFHPDTATEDDSASIYDTTGLKDGRLMVTGETILHEGVQIRVRSFQYTTGMNKINDIKDYLDTVKGTIVTVDSIQYKVNNASIQGSVIPLGVGGDPKQRHNCTLNLLLTITQI